MTNRNPGNAMRVLFVEDDTKLVNSLRRMAKSRPDLEAHFAQDGEAALKVLAETTVDIVVADMRMPVMDGATLLNIVQDKYPEVARIVLSGQSERDSVFQVVKPAHQFLSKPCPFEEIMAVLERVYRLRSVFTDKRLRDVVCRIDMLPVLPDSYKKLLAEIESENCSMSKVGALIAKDPALTADILKVVNSSFFGLPQPVSTPVKAATYLGTDLLRGLIISANLFSTFDSASYRDFSVALLWNHAMNTALFCRTLCRREPFNLDGDEGFNAGLLHDLGKLILAEKFPDDYRQVLTILKKNAMPTFQAEQEVFGATHAELGAYLLGLWGFPESTVKAVAGHHQPERYNEERPPLLTILHVANVLEHELVVIHHDRALPHAQEGYLEHAGVDPETMTAWRETCQELLLQDSSAEEAQA